MHFLLQAESLFVDSVCGPLLNNVDACLIFQNIDGR